ncbi:MAG: efflux RND transporter periplasmic adaptor subunit [Flavobacteriaceae bacterium]
MNTTTEADSNKIIISNQQFESEHMQLGQLHEEAFNNLVQTNGLVDVPPENKSIISTFMGGYVTKIPLLIGDAVKKGQLVATLENIEFVGIQQHYLEIAEQMAYLKNEYERQKKLYNENITSQKNFLKAESDYKSTLAIYNGLQQKLRMMNIDPNAVEQSEITSSINLYAPIAGSVTKVNVSNGSFVSSSAELLEIINTEHIHLELNVFEKDILKIKKDQKIKFNIPEASSQIYDAEVHLVGTSIDENRTIKVHAHIEDEENANFIVGMFVEANIITDSVTRFALPNEAITKIDDNYFVLVLENKTDSDFTFKKEKIEIGTKNEAYTEVLNYNNLAGKDILIKGGFLIFYDIT